MVILDYVFQAGISSRIDERLFAQRAATRRREGVVDSLRGAAHDRPEIPVVPSLFMTSP